MKYRSDTLSEELYKSKINEAASIEDKEELRKKAIKDFSDKVKNNATCKKIISSAKKYGYKADLSYIDSVGVPYIRMECIKSADSEYKPKVYYNDNSMSGKVGFKIQTNHYGDMDSKEYEKFLKGCQDAFNLIKELEKLDLNTLEKEPNWNKM